MCRHVQQAIVHRGHEAVMDLALRSTAGVAGIVHLFGEVEEVVEVVALLVVADRLYYATGHGLRTSSRIDPAVGPHGKRPTGVRVRMACKWIPLNGIGLFVDRLSFIPQ